MPKDAEELALRLRRIVGLTDRLRLVQTDSIEAQKLSARIKRETAELNQPLPRAPK